METNTIQPDVSRATLENKPNAILYGKKTIGFPFIFPDLEHLVNLLRDDKFGYMGNYCLKKMSTEEGMRYIHEQLVTGQILIWAIYTKEGRSAKRAGYAYLTDMSHFSCEVGGIMDIQFAKGLGKQLRRDKYTYAEDAFRSLIKYAFEKMGMQRVQSVVLEFNRRSIALDYKVGFKKEGVMRKAFDLDGQLTNLQIFSILKEEYTHG